VTALLDTHTILWAGQSRERLSPRVLAILSDESYGLLVSAASAWEIATKVRLGKFPEARALEERFSESMNLAGFTLTTISVEDALRAGRLAGSHKDPFDRMIAAQALTLDVPVISIDTKLDAFGVRRIW
jgi:PIN domain nuclease of toxin-antitoxin system